MASAVNRLETRKLTHPPLPQLPNPINRLSTRDDGEPGGPFEGAYPRSPKVPSRRASLPDDNLQQRCADVNHAAA